jgi:tRNA A37 N6-isopentenylltransferase MiaA
VKTLNSIRQEYEGTFPKPSTQPWFPDDITTASEDDLGKLLTLYTLWKNHISEQTSIDDAEFSALKEEIELEKAKQLVKLSEDADLKSTFSAKEDRMAYVLSRKHIEVRCRQAAELSAVLKIEKALLDNMESRYACVSRELTRRQARWNQ